MNWMKDWDKISYVIQILAACFLFIRYAKKREHFLIRLISWSFLTIVISFVLGSFIPLYQNGLWFVCYTLVMLGMAYGLIRMTTTLSGRNTVYTILVAVTVQHIAFDLFLIERQFQISFIALDVSIFALVYLIAYFLYAPTVIKNESERDQYRTPVGKGLTISVFTMCIVVWGFSMLENSDNPVFQSSPAMRVIYRIIDSCICIYVLWVQYYQQKQGRLQQEIAGLNQAMEMQADQYTLKREMVDAINLKCHDLKHQIRQIRKMQGGDVKEYLNDLENDVLIYDSAMRVGNRALDIILMDKGLYCKNHDIQWTCMIDGGKLDFMKDADINSIFGNALDNAVTAVMNVKDADMRVITLNMLEQNRLLVIQIRNYYEGSLKFRDGIPETTKDNHMTHGYGMKSIRYTAEKYKGVMTVNAKEGIFTLQVLIPIPERSINE